jgi:hypothetical protein
MWVTTALLGALRALQLGGGNWEVDVVAAVPRRLMGTEHLFSTQALKLSKAYWGPLFFFIYFEVGFHCCSGWS